MYPLSQPDITDSEQAYVARALSSGRLSLGPYLAEFEQKLADVAGRKHAVAVSSGTAGLHLILRVLKVREGDEVITTPLSFIASTNCIEYVGARPVFVDIDPKTGCIDPAAVEDAVTPRTKAILAVDAYGFPAGYTELKKIAKAHDLYLIEDAAEALGSRYQGKPCGSFGDAAIYAFYPNKPITCAEGGAVLVNNKRFARSVRSMSNQGRAVTSDGWGEQHTTLGFNYRLSELHAALGCAQLNRFNTILARRRRILRWYIQAIKKVGVPVTVPAPYDEEDPSVFCFIVLLPRSGIQKTVIEYLAHQNIQARAYFHPIHLQPLYKERYGYRTGEYPATESWAERVVALPFYGALTQRDVHFIVGVLAEAVRSVRQTRRKK